ncbi:MAG: thiamine pyrophosphate-dependent enzyme [Desulfobacterales bacterium]
MYSGHVACPGCGAVIAMKFALSAMGPKTAIVMPACCWGVISGSYPQTALKVPVMHTAFASAGATAAGLRAALDARGQRDTAVMVWAGDGGTFDIGLQALSGAVERNEDFIYVCYDNEAYMNTGVQRSSATPFGMRTTTTPGEGWKKDRKKNIMEIMAAHGIPYAATADIAFPEDMIRKFKKARDLKGGSRFIHVFAACPTGWKFPSDRTIAFSRLAVKTNIFPLYEIEGGVRYTLNYRGGLPVKSYLKGQGRFAHLTDEDVRHIQRMVDEQWDALMQKIMSAHPEMADSLHFGIGR